MRMKSMAVVGFVLLALVLGASTSVADPKGPVAVPADVSSASVAAWECSSGDFCAWTGLNGTGSRCAWTNADPDWRGGAIQCSWSGSQRVQSYWNRGTSTSYRGVKLYQSANYTNLAYCAPQGTAWNIADGGTFLRSHQWGNWTPNTCGP
jgi:hypothetical protein